MSSVIRSVIGWLMAIRVTGDVEQCGHERRVLVVANCPSRVAGLMLGWYLPRRPLVALPPGPRRGLLERWLGRLVDHVTLDVSDPMSLKKLTHWLRQGRLVVVFPEGRVSDGQSVLKTYPVPALAALNSGAAVVPVAIFGSSHCDISGKRLPARGMSFRVLAAARIEKMQHGCAHPRREDAVRQLTQVMQRVRVVALARKPVFESILDAINKYGRSREMIEDQSEQVRSYGAIVKGSLVISRWIKRFSAPGENVGLLLPNVVPSVCAVLGTMAAGRVPAVLNFTAGVAAVKSSVTAANVKTIVTSSKFIERAKLEPLIQALGDYRIVYLEDIRSRFGWFDKLWLLGFALWFPRKVVASAAMSDPAVVLFTSGSEDRPKGVVLSHEAIVTNVSQIRSAFDFLPRDKIFNPLPIYHAYSFTAGMMLSLMTGTRMFLYVSPLKYRAIPELIYRHDCSVLFGTSTFLSYYAQNASTADFRTLRFVIAGGEKLSREVAALWMDKFGLRIYEGYGATEAAPVISLATRDNYRVGCAGRFLPGVEYQIQRVEGIERGGVLHIRAPNLMLGYYRPTRPGVIDTPRSVVGVGWYDTGDVVEVDGDGMVTIVGRTRRFTKVAGEMVSLDVMEQIARAASPSHHHAAIVLLQEHGIETSVLFTTDASLTRVHLAEAARACSAPELAVARRIETLPEIPLLSTGKTDYVSLKSLLEDDTYGRLLSAATGRSVNVAGAQQTGESSPKQDPAPRTSG
jgi:acyl-[acyl-carrier-protein]-phospholipid O-acyltransferase/long-chain-fatty-acid--[acyl-carrier-protein] ligase